MDNFENLKIVKYLYKKKSVFSNLIRSCIDKFSPVIETIPGLYPNYTFHDLGHSYRVCRYMEILMFDNDLKNRKIEDYDDYELALAFLAGFLHDIGMSYDKGKVIFEIKQNNFKGINNDYKTLKNKLNDDDEIVKECVRKTHPERSKDYILENKDLFTVSDVNIANTVGIICASHGMDESELAKISSSDFFLNESANPLFLSCILRLSDIVDSDIARVPYCWFKFINKSTYSETEWKRQLIIKNNLEKRFCLNSTKTLLDIIFSGTCNEPEVCRSYLNYIANVVEKEIKISLRMCEAFLDEKYFLYLSNNVIDDVKKIGFESCDLRFNLNFNAITNLLMGENIYSSKTAGLRELIQNAIDACNIKKHICKSKPYSSKYKPKISIILDEEKKLFIVEDNGSGMNKSIIMNHFLNIGDSYYKSTDFLDLNLDFKPIGKFGIGFLACYLLSQNVTIITKHIKETEGLKLNLLKDTCFVTTEKDTTLLESGTRIMLDLKQVLCVFHSADQIKEFINKTFCVDCCKINFCVNGKSELVGCKNNIINEYKKIPMFKEQENFNNKFEMCLIDTTVNNIQMFLHIGIDKTYKNIFKSNPRKIYIFDKETDSFIQKKIENISGTFTAIAGPIHKKDSSLSFAKFEKTNLQNGDYVLFIEEDDNKDSIFSNKEKLLKIIHNVEPNFSSQFVNSSKAPLYDLFIDNSKINRLKLGSWNHYNDDKSRLFQDGVLVTDNLFYILRSIYPIKIFGSLILSNNEDVMLDVSRGKISKGSNLIFGALKKAVFDFGKSRFHEFIENENAISILYDFD